MPTFWTSGPVKKMILGHSRTAGRGALVLSKVYSAIDTPPAWWLRAQFRGLTMVEASWLRGH
jgi:hypothetical protein